MARFIPADSSQPVREVKPKNGKNFTLREMSQLLGCEVVDFYRIGKNAVMLLDEVSGMLEEGRNARATKEARFVLPTGDELFGDALVCTNKEVRDSE